jgi:hypothetical protein
MKTRTVGTLAALLLFGAQLCHAGPSESPDQVPRAATLRMLPSGALETAGLAATAGEGREMRAPDTTDLLLSLALPGLGELRTGHTNRALVHFVAEAAIWTTFTVYRVQGGLRKDDYIEYAEVYAGVLDASGESDGYYRDLARFRRSDPGPMSYNELEVRATARALHPDDLDARNQYIEENEIRGARAWNWETDEHWMTYGAMRESSELSYQRSRFAVAAAVTNRIVSVLGLARARGPADSRINVGMTPSPGGEGYYTAITLSKSF